MDPKSAEDVARCIQSILYWFWRLFTRAIPIVTLVVIGYLGWQIYQRSQIKQVVILAGPAGGEGVRQAQAIATAIRSASSPFGTQYDVRVENTDGYEENRRRVSQAQGGNVIAFAQDGFGESANVAILLPLEGNYLHAICRAGFLNEQKIVIEQKDGDPVLFSQVLPQLKKHSHGRVFLGPPQSGTRQLAEIVLQQFHVDPGLLSTNGIGNWQEMRKALKNGTIDFAFYSGPRNSEILRNIARDGKSILVGLDDVCKAITGEHFEIWEEELPKNSYHALTKEVGNPATTVGVGFSTAPAWTIVSRKVLIGPRSLTTLDAYLFAKCAQTALEDQIGRIGWSAVPPSQQKEQRQNFQFRVHEGAELLKQKQPPPVSSWNPLSWPKFVQLPTLGLITIISVLWFIFRDLTTNVMASLRKSLGLQLKPRTAIDASDFGAEFKEEYDEIAREIENVPLDAKMREFLERRLSSLESRINAARAKNRLDEQAAKDLAEGVKTLRERLNPPKPDTGGPAVEPVPPVVPAGSAGESRSNEDRDFID